MSFSKIYKYKTFWLCRCDCGNEKVICRGNLTAGTRSCGCLVYEYLRSAARKASIGTHRDIHSPEYHSWSSMKSRCLCKTNPNYPKYGGRGITVSKRWIGPEGYRNFLADMGRRPTLAHSLDRYPDNNGNYEPRNVRWATPLEQGINQRTRSKKSAWWDGECLRINPYPSAKHTVSFSKEEAIELGKVISAGLQ